MNSTLTLNANLGNANTATVKTNIVTLAQIGRTLARKWDMFAVIGLMLSSTAYGVFAIAHVA